MADVIVIGGGVSGLTCAITLLDAGHNVTLYARDFSPNTTSDAAAAIWYPYKAYPMDRVLGWCGQAFEVFAQLCAAPEAGVSMVRCVELYDHPVPDPWWKEAVRRFDRASSADLPPGYADGFVFEVPLIETPIYMAYLMDRVKSTGAVIEHRAVNHFDEIAQPGRLIINCAGLGARELTGDASLHPIRGQVVKVSAPDAIRHLLDEESPRGLTYIIPRRDGVILGGTAEDDDWRLELDPATADSILERCRRIEPALNGAAILGHKVGLRPGRPTVRLELEMLTDSCAVIHNYGHGGAGFTLSWGCAEEVLRIASDFINVVG